jgi:RNA-binding protein NOB1
MGIPLLATDGMIIKRVKSYVLECFTCYGICRDNSKQFCPSCGHNTLLRVTCSFNLDGSFVLYRKKGYKVSLRGRKVGNELN